MRILIDCDVLLEVALDRMPFADDSSSVLDWAWRHPAPTAIAWHSLANISYLASGEARKFLGEFLKKVKHSRSN